MPVVPPVTLRWSRLRRCWSIASVAALAGRHRGVRRCAECGTLDCGDPAVGRLYGGIERPGTGSGEEVSRPIRRASLARALDKQLAAKPGMVGTATDHQREQEIVARLRSFGLHPHVSKYYVYMSTPKRISLQLTSPVHFTARDEGEVPQRRDRLQGHRGRLQRVVAIWRCDRAGRLRQLRHDPGLPDAGQARRQRAEQDRACPLRRCVPRGEDQSRRRARREGRDPVLRSGRRRQGARTGVPEGSVARAGRDPARQRPGVVAVQRRPAHAGPAGDEERQADQPEAREPCQDPDHADRLWLGEADPGTSRWTGRAEVVAGRPADEVPAGVGKHRAPRPEDRLPHPSGL